MPENKHTYWHPISSHSAVPNWDEIVTEQRALVQNLSELKQVPAELLPDLAPGKMLVIAGRPGSGKSTVGLSLIRQACVERGCSALILSLEMSRAQVMLRIESLGAGSLPTASLIVADGPNMSLQYITDKIVELKGTLGVEVVLIDYLQLITWPWREISRRDVMDRIVEALRHLAVELGIAIIVVSQLNQAPEHRVSSRPNLADFRESSAIAQTADTIILLNRPELESDALELTMYPKRDYTFESFIVNDGNRFPHNASVAVSEQPGRKYNPLFISGDPGLGKTHLLHAIRNYAYELHPDLRVKYTTAEDFSAELQRLLRDEKYYGLIEHPEFGLAGFRNDFKAVDVLLFDDLHLLNGRRALEELFRLTDHLLANGKQVVYTSALPPKKLSRLEDWHRNHIKTGLVTAFTSRKASAVIGSQVEMRSDKKITANKRQGGLGRGIANLIPKEIIWSANLWDIPVVYSIRAAQADNKETVCRQAIDTLDSTLRSQGAIIPIDPAEVRALTQDSDWVVVGFGSATGQANATNAAEAALSARLMTKTIPTAQSVILAIQGGPDLGLPDIQAVTNVVQERTIPTVNLIIGVAKSDTLDNEIRVTILAVTK